MAFHFDARADSSDEDDGIDLSTWKGGASSKPVAGRPAPVAQMLAQPMQMEEDEDDTIMVSQSVSDKSKSRERSRSERPRTSGFQAINNPSRIERSESAQIIEDSPMFIDDDEEEEQQSTSRTRRIFVPVLSHVEVDRDDYQDFTGGTDTVRRVLRKHSGKRGQITYTVQFADYSERKIVFEDLIELDNGQQALDAFTTNPPSEEYEEPEFEARPAKRAKRSANMSSTRPRSRRTVQSEGFVSTVDNIDGSDVDQSDDEIQQAPRTRGRKRKQDHSQYVEVGDEDDDDDFGDSGDELARPTRRSGRNSTGNGNVKKRSLRARRVPTGLTDDEEDGDGLDEDDDGDDMPFLESDLPGARKRRPGRPARRQSSVSQTKRHPARATRHTGGMQEVEIDDIYRSDSDAQVPMKPKAVGAKEAFKSLPRGDEFRLRHNQHCDTCADGEKAAPLIYCQGCSLAYHKVCLGHRGNREHLVTKVDDNDFVLQCRRCVAFPRKKDETAPDHGLCQVCLQHGASCQPFRPRKTTMQEQRDRDENDGIDPTYEVNPSLLNNADNVLFRCIKCFRGFHFEHLPSLNYNDNDEADAEQRFREYGRDWECKDCANMPAKVGSLIAWKPVHEDQRYEEELEEQDKLYLVRWEGLSYFRAVWKPGPWVWGSCAPTTRKAFTKRNEPAKLNTADAIPEDYLRTDIVLDIEWTSIVTEANAEINKQRIDEIKRALIKYKGLGYEEAVWEEPPSKDDADRYSDFVMAFNEWIAGSCLRVPRPGTIKKNLEKVRLQDFNTLERTEQPDSIEGGKLMKYQLEGLNWLYYKWFSESNAILADEMGLGKTIQIISFLATLVQRHNCSPFLVVVPNSTCPNWRREIKRWAPSLRVVAYYGSRESRDLVYQHELYPDGKQKDMKAHIVVTSYEAAADDNCRKFFRGVAWQGLIVDEGQRLKNDSSLLYNALGALKAPFKVLLTGTPLQNNIRELFNLLHFLDDQYNPTALEQQYEDLDQGKINELHDMIRPFFLRRTKAEVLTFLPPMAQIIVPVSMTYVQKKVYRTILAKNPELMRAIFSSESTFKQNERASISNILMQLRKCLCHPFVYSQSIEDRNAQHLHRNLVDASGKMMLLELLLPKLQERGHRVLIFSQFLSMLDMVEDFMDGMQLSYHRLDGTVSSLVKQKRIDEFNSPGSPTFAFLLSTRAGGVGINLATADTVIILDPDFNPHQDIQALSRAHRIGQTKKVLCFQLVTRASAEERIMQIGRKKLALEHVLIQELGDEDSANENDLVSVLRHGASELFEDNGEQNIIYDSASVERLLDRSHIEDTAAGQDKRAETQFSHARIWANNAGTLEASEDVEEEEHVPDPGVWASILKERERLAAEEAAAKAEAFGRGRRARANVDYAGGTPEAAVGGLDILPLPIKKRKKDADDSDTDFQAESEGDDDDEGEIDFEHGRGKMLPPEFQRAIMVLKPDKSKPKSFDGQSGTNGHASPNGGLGPKSVVGINCKACLTFHRLGSCPLKLAGVEHCNLCGMAHFGHGRVCPHIQSETQVCAMLEALKESTEQPHLIQEAKRYLRGLKGNLVQLKKQRKLKEQQARDQANEGAQWPPQPQPQSKADSMAMHTHMWM